jgi:hypothetical protein
LSVVRFEKVSSRGPQRTARSSFAVVLSCVLTAIALAGCGSGDSVQPGPDAANAACTALLGRLPDRVLDRARTSLHVTGAAAWGDPAIVLRCGVPVPGPTAEHCLDANGLSWIIAETKHTLRFISYGRTPAVELRIPASVERSSAPGALVDLADAVRPIPASTKCIGADDF